MAQRFYENTIWTNHALDRLSDRRMSQQMVWKAFQYPDSSSKDKDGATICTRRFGIHTITVIAKQNEKYEWIIISCWMDPPLKGTQDDAKRQRYYKYKNAGLLTKIQMQIFRFLFNQDF